MKYNLIDGKPQAIDFINVNVSNPADGLLEMLGIGKNVVETEIPEYNAETHHLQESYTEDETTIYHNYTVALNEVIENADATDLEV